MAEKNIIGRTDQIAILKQSLNSSGAEFIAVYGRRRIGKTYLIREYFDSGICFEMTGIPGSSLKDQLLNFSISLGKSMGTGINPAIPASWFEAFLQLESFLESLKNTKLKGKRVVFIDELPWLNTAKSNFLAALQHFWNGYGSKQTNLILVVCGSSASWMIQHIVRSRGGLHNRLTRQIRLLPFTLAETREFLRNKGIRKLNNYSIIQLYMALGGVPYYLNFIKPGLSAAQLIEMLCFADSGPLRREYEQLYRSLFEKGEQHMKIVELLSEKRKGMSRSEILAQAGVKSGGTASLILEELEESGFIESGIPFGKKANDVVYRLSDEFSLFHLKWIKPVGKRSQGEGYWMTRQNSQQMKIWAGYCFENICMKHVQKLKIKLGISGIETQISTWRFQPPKESDLSGAQIDLLIDRKDGIINLCEMKFYNTEYTIDSSYAKELKQKIEVFRKQTGTRKNIFLTLVTPFGINRNEYSNELEVIDITIDDLF